jgi:hypothetical protein
MEDQLRTCIKEGDINGVNNILSSGKISVNAKIDEYVSNI